jgi:hypothetical protein
MKAISPLFRLSLLAAFAFNMLACSRVAFNNNENDSSQGLTPEVVKNADGVVNPVDCHEIKDPKNPDKKCFVDIFTQPRQNTGVIDILFVVDTSGSLAGERQKIVTGIQNYINGLPEDADFNIAVMLAHGSTSVWSGRLFKAANEPVVLKSLDLTNAQIQSYLGTKLNTVVDDQDSDGGEEGIFSLFKGVTVPAKLQESQAAGFFRNNAALSVVFVSDENDICATYPSGVTPVVDPDGREVPARIRDCEGIVAQGLTTQLKNLKGSQPLTVSGIIYADSPVPVQDENELGYGYTDMIALNSGIAIDIANDDIATELQGIAEIDNQQMGVQNQFTLAHDLINEATLVVTVNDQSVPFKLQGNVVTITQAVPAGAIVRIYYCLKKSNDHKHCKRCKHHERKKKLIELHERCKK